MENENKGSKIRRSAQSDLFAFLPCSFLNYTVATDINKCFAAEDFPSNYQFDYRKCKGIFLFHEWGYRNKDEQR
jgi:hypothetical protein